MLRAVSEISQWLVYEVPEMCATSLYVSAEQSDKSVFQS